MMTSAAILRDAVDRAGNPANKDFATGLHSERTRLTFTSDRPKLKAMSKQAPAAPPRSVDWRDLDELARGTAPPSAKPLDDLALWLKWVERYHQTYLGGAATGAERRVQKRALSALTSLGEGLVDQARQQGVPPGAGVTLADVEATLEALYVSQRVSFGDMTEARRKQVLDEVFAVS